MTWTELGCSMVAGFSLGTIVMYELSLRQTMRLNLVIDDLQRRLLRRILEDESSRPDNGESK